MKVNISLSGLNKHLTNKTTSNSATGKVKYKKGQLLLITSLDGTQQSTAGKFQYEDALQIEVQTSNTQHTTTLLKHSTSPQNSREIAKAPLAISVTPITEEQYEKIKEKSTRTAPEIAKVVKQIANLDKEKSALKSKLDEMKKKHIAA